jgi:hypothetical protein
MSSQLVRDLRRQGAHDGRAARVAQVLRTALVNPAMNSAANAHASSRKTQPTAVSQAGTPVTYTVPDQPGRYQLLSRVSKLESKI